MTLAKLLVAIGASTRGFQRGLAGAGKSIDALERKTGRMRRGFGNAAGGLASFAKNAIFVGSIALVALAGGLGLVAQKAIAWEDAFAGVAKTVQATPAQLAELSRGIRNLSLEIPVAANELAGIAEQAGALGIAREDIIAFTKTVAELAVTTNLTSATAADALGRIGTILKLHGKDFELFGSALVALGNQGASTETEIIAITQRFAASGKQAGLSTDQILGYASAISSLGVEPESAGSSLSRMFSNLIQETALATSKGKAFAKVAGMSFKGFSKIVKTDTNKAMLLFLKNLGKLDKFSASKALASVGITDVRQRDAVLKLAQNYGFLTDQLGIASKAIKDNSAITQEAEKRFATTKSQLQILGNILTDVAVTLGMALLPVIISLIKPLGEWLKANETLIAQLGTQLAVGIQAVIGFIGNVVTAVVAWVDANGPLINQIGTTLYGAISAVVAFIRDSLIPAFLSIVSWIGDNVIPKVQAFITTMTGPGGVVESVLGVVGPIVNNLIPAFVGIVESLFGGGKKQGLIPAIGDLIGVMWGDGTGPLATALKAIANILTKVVLPAIQLVIDIINNLIGLVRSAVAEIDKLLAKIPQIPRFNTKVDNGGIFNPFAPGANQLPSGKAAGGPIMANRPYLVGESGPELVVPRSASTVVPNDELGGRGGDTNITIYNPTPRAAEGDISRVMRRLGGLGMVATRPAGA